MAPSIFVTRQSSQQDSSPPRSRLKTLSALLNPFSSNSTSSVILTAKQVVPSAPLPYEPPKSDISLTDFGHFALSGSPFRVYVRDGISPNSEPSLDGLPSTGDRSSNLVSGLPSSHRPLEDLRKGSEIIQKPSWKELPTLASAINIADPVSTSDSQSSVPTLDQPLPAVEPRRTLPRSSTSTSSIFEAYRSRKTLKRSLSRSSTKQSEPEIPGQPVRRMSRRLSFDSILHPFSAQQSRRKDKNNPGPPDGDQWSLVDHADVPVERTEAEKELAARQHRLALPPMRGLRTKFSVGQKSGAQMAGHVKAEVSARRRIHEWDDNGRHKGKTEVSDIKSAAGQGALKRMGQTTSHPLQKPSQTSQTPSMPNDPEPGITRPIGNVDNQASTTALPALSPNQFSPAQDRKRPIQTPCNALSVLLMPSASHTSLLLSPAQDDKSILDPSRSPIPFSISTEDFSAFPTIPPRPSAEEMAEMRQRQAEADQEHEGQSETGPQPRDEETQVAKRQQSLSEIRDAFSRMRDISDLDISITGSVVSSRPVSEVDEAVNRLENTPVRKGPSLDLGTLDRGLKAVVAQSMREANLGTPIQHLSQQTIRASASVDEIDGAGTVSLATSVSSDMMTAQTSNDETASILQDETRSALSQAPSGRSWHTAKDDLSIAFSSTRLLPRSKSRSIHDLASLASGRNLVDHVEQTQGEGWWSVERDRVLGRRASNVDSLRLKFDSEEDKRLLVLEKLAKSSTLPHRPRFADCPLPNLPNLVDIDTPTRRGSRPGLSERVSYPKGDYPKTAFVDRVQRDIESVHEWRPSSVQPRKKPAYHGSRPSLLGASSFSRDSHRESLHVDDTPTRPSKRGGPFANSRISPDIARRASYLNMKVDGDGESIASSSVSRREVVGGSDRCVDEITAEHADQMKKLRDKHGLELDAILGALSGAKNEVKSLQEEMTGLRKELSDTVTEREVLKEKVKSFEERLADLEARGQIRDLGHSTRGRSFSVASTLLPNLAVPDASLVMNASPLEPPLAPLSPLDHDFDRAVDAEREKRFRQRAGKNRQSSLYDLSMTTANLTMTDDGDSDDEGGWMLKLKRGDEAHLDDL